MEFRRCTKCGEVKELSIEFFGVRGDKQPRNSLFLTMCRECAAAYSRRYREKGGDWLRAKKRAFRAANIDSMREKERAYRSKNRDVLLEQKRGYYKRNKKGLVS